jgi:hypothetical protein
MQEVPILARKCASVLDQDAKTDIFSLLKVNEGAVTVGRISFFVNVYVSLQYSVYRVIINGSDVSLVVMFWNQEKMST